MPRWVRFPWARLEPGQGFFVPCLDTAKMTEMVLRDVLQHRLIRLEATPGVWRGLYGVWFQRL